MRVPATLEFTGVTIWHVDSEDQVPKDAKVYIVGDALYVNGELVGAPAVVETQDVEYFHRWGSDIQDVLTRRYIINTFLEF